MSCRIILIGGVHNCIGAFEAHQKQRRSFPKYKPGNNQQFSKTKGWPPSFFFTRQAVYICLLVLVSCCSVIPIIDLQDTRWGGGRKLAVVSDRIATGSGYTCMYVETMAKGRSNFFCWIVVFLRKPSNLVLYFSSSVLSFRERFLGCEVFFLAGCFFSETF